jgi:hypothetical protein
MPGGMLTVGEMVAATRVRHALAASRAVPVGEMVAARSAQGVDVLAATGATHETRIGPWRRTRGGQVVQSATVEPAPPAVGPPSSIRSTDPSKYRRTASAVVGGASPLGLALGAVTGKPAARTKPSATGWPGILTPTVPVSPVSAGGRWAAAASTR